MRINHSYFSNLALNLAEKNLGKTKSNPSVGCIVVKNNSVISSGITSVSGRPHAEFNALNKSINFNGSKMYVSLEPCTHYGKTPPCTNIIAKKKIKDVYYTFEDPDVRTYKQAKKILNKKKINLKKINCQKNNIYKSYFFNKKYNLPFIDAKIAISKDFFTINKKNRWITNIKSRRLAQYIRSKYDCIISTSETINKDNSLLNCRLNGFDYNKPDLIIIDRNLKLKKKLKLFKIAKTRKTYLVTLKKNTKKLNYFKRKKISIIKIDELDNKKDFFYLLKKLFDNGKRRILIETGLIFLNKMIKFKLINDLFIFKSGKNLKIDGYNNSKPNYLKKYKLKNKIKVNLDNDTLFKVSAN